MSKRTHDPFRTFDIAVSVLTGTGYGTVSKRFELDDEYVRLTVHRFCLNANPYLYRILASGKQRPPMVDLRFNKNSFIPDIDSYCQTKRKVFLSTANDERGAQATSEEAAVDKCPSPVTRALMLTGEQS
jgi:hypothetical protein